MTDEAMVLHEPAPGGAEGARPWPRYLARAIDTLVFGFIGSVIVVIVLELSIDGGAAWFIRMTQGVGGVAVSSFLAVVVSVPFTTLLLAYAQTPGKWLLGIRVRDEAGQRLRPWVALKRETWVLLRGLGLGLPVVALYTQIMSYSDLKDDGITEWDRKLRCTVRHAPATPLWWARAVLGACMVIAVNAWAYIDMLRSAFQS